MTEDKRKCAECLNDFDFEDLTNAGDEIFCMGCYEELSNKAVSTHCSECKTKTPVFKLHTVFNEKTMEPANVCETCQLTVKHLIKYPVRGLHYSDNS